MIQVIPAAEPATFNDRVRVPGLRAIAEMVGESPIRRPGRPRGKVADRREDIRAEKFPPYWTEALDDLKASYDHICAYSCFRIHPVTGAGSVDHFAAKSREWNRVYEWTNYRLACSRLNARKNDFGDVLDPFEIRDGLFQLELVGFQVIPDPDLDEVTRDQVQKTIDRLRLDDFRDDRATDAVNYWERHISLVILTRESPFVARELRRQGRLNPGDV